MSACCTIVPTTPFWPCRLLNLSPTSGRRVCRSSACRRAAPRPSGACPQSAARRQPAVPGSRPQEATSAWPCCLTGYRVVAAGGRGALPPSASACKGRTTARRAAHLNRAGRDMAGQRAAAARLDDHVAVLVGGQQHLVHDHALPSASGSGTSSAPRCACARAPSGASACGPSERGTAAIAPCLLLAGLVQLAAQGRCAALRRLELNRFGVCARHRPCVSTHASAAHQPRRRRARAAPRLTGSAGERAGGLGRVRAQTPRRLSTRRRRATRQPCEPS